jgi:8-oxo-dGTP pyrophosphatase MutT (NUDIX family)
MIIQYIEIKINYMATRDRVSQINCIVFKPEGISYKFLILKRAPDHGGFWQPITGGVHEGEEQISAVKRELMEETGIIEHRQIINLKYTFSFTLPRYGSLTENVYAVEVKPGVEVVLSDEHTEYRWLDFEESITLIKYDSNKEGFRKLWKILNS